jgi:NTE family protein
MHAPGQLPVYTEWVVALERVHVLRLLAPTIGRPGLFKGECVIQVLRNPVGDCAIEALPMVFTPVQHRHRCLIDRAVVNAVPVSPTEGDATDLTIAVHAVDAVCPSRACN